VKRRADVVARALASLAHGAPRRVADVGAGDGDVGRRVAETLDADRVAFDVASAGRGIEPSSIVFDGVKIPAADQSFDVALLSDVLHHAEAPEALLRECLRIAPVVLVKDHFSEGTFGDVVLTAMDVWGNAARGVASPGRYLSALGWRSLFERVQGRPVAWVWPLDVHPRPIRLFTRSERQFAARLERAS
jgi:SAM-dependent methyltransferase